MLKITNDGRKLALDQRLADDSLPDETSGKVAACVRNIHSVWERSKAERSTQLVFCDLSIPKDDGSFNVYDDVKAKPRDRRPKGQEVYRRGHHLPDQYVLDAE